MSRKRSEKIGTAKAEWLQFQELIGKVEEMLKPSGAVVRSPDMVWDYVSESKREVDASIWMGKDLITVECRRHKGAQCVKWIEELATKRVDIRATRTIAVSSSGFSPAAAKKAAVKGIEVNTFKELEKNAPGFVSQGFTFAPMTGIVTLEATTIDFGDGQRPLTPDETKMMRFPELDEKCLRRKKNGNILSVWNVFEGFRRSPDGKAWLRKMIMKGQPRFHYSVEFAEPMECDVGFGMRDVKEVLLQCRIDYESDVVGLERRGEYSDDSGKIADVAQTQRTKHGVVGTLLQDHRAGGVLKMNVEYEAPPGKVFRFLPGGIVEIANDDEVDQLVAQGEHRM